MKITAFIAAAIFAALILAGLLTVFFLPLCARIVGQVYFAFCMPPWQIAAPIALLIPTNGGAPGVFMWIWLAYLDGLLILSAALATALWLRRKYSN